MKEVIALTKAAINAVYVTNVIGHKKDYYENMSTESF